MSSEKPIRKSSKTVHSQENENERKELTRTERIKRRQRVFYLVISLVGACTLWLYVMEAVNPTVERTFTGIRVELMNESELLERDLAVTTKQEQYVKVRISGKRRTLMEMEDSDILATADASECTAGENYIEVRVRAPHSVEVEKIISPQIKLHVEPIITDSREVEVLFTGDVEEGTQPVAVDQQISEAAVTGVESQVKKVSRVVAVVNTELLSDSQAEIEARLIPVDKKGREVSGITLSHKKTAVSALIYALKEVGLDVSSIGEVDGDYRLVSFEYPETIRIVIPFAESDNVRSVTADTIDISSFKKSKTVDLDLNLPENAQLAEGQETPQAEIKVAKIITRTVRIDTDDIVIENLSDGKEIAFDAASVDIVLRGTSTELSDIDRNDIKVSVDASRADSSVEELPLIVEVDAGSEDQEDLVEVEEAAAEVTVS